jgi:hypothetical protein
LRVSENRWNPRHTHRKGEEKCGDNKSMFHNIGSWSNLGDALVSYISRPSGHFISEKRLASAPELDAFRTVKWNETRLEIGKMGFV